MVLLQIRKNVLHSTKNPLAPQTPKHNSISLNPRGTPSKRQGVLFFSPLNNHERPSLDDSCLGYRRFWPEIGALGWSQHVWLLWSHIWLLWAHVWLLWAHSELAWPGELQPFHCCVNLGICWRWPTVVSAPWNFLTCGMRKRWEPPPTISQWIPRQRTGWSTTIWFHSSSRFWYHSWIGHRFGLRKHTICKTYSCSRPGHTFWKNSKKC